MKHSFRIELTLENLKVIKLWYHLAQKDREVTRGDNDQEMTKRDYVSKETLEENR